MVDVFTVTTKGWRAGVDSASRQVWAGDRSLRPTHRMDETLSRRAFGALLGGWGLAAATASGATTRGLLSDTEDSSGTVIIGDGSSSGSATRLNAGGAAYTAADGTSFSADQYNDGGTTDATTDSISGTLDETLYQDERLGNDSTLAYDIPLPDDTYDLLFHFAEIFFEQDGERVFDVAVDGTTEISSLDIHAEVGHDAALRTAVKDVAVSNGSLPLDFTASTNYPTVSAIEVVPASAGVRINAGGRPTVDSNDILYAEDDYSTGGIQNATTDTIANTSDDIIYQTERYQDPNTSGPLVYDIPIANGQYNVTLHFAEIEFSQDGQRVFDVDVESNGKLKTEISNLDIHAEVGHDTALQRRIKNVKVRNGSLRIEFAASVENAKVSAIDIVPK